MKNQYFGDIRDLFKFDLYDSLVSNVPFHHLFYLPMLTPNDSTLHGEHRNYEMAPAGTRNNDLITFFRSHAAQRDRRDVRHIEDYFISKNQMIHIYDNAGATWFKHQGRERYFAEIPPNELSKSLILVDPDVGLEPRTSDDRHIRYFELFYLFEKMNQDSVLMLFQFLNPTRRMNRAMIERRKLAELFDGMPLAIADNNVVFLLIGKSRELKDSLSMVLDSYTSIYSKLERWKP